MDDVDILHGIAVFRKWDNSWFREGYGVVRIFLEPKHARSAIRNELKSQNRIRQEYDYDKKAYIPNTERYVNDLNRELTPDDYVICKVQMITEPVEELPWN